MTFTITPTEYEILDDYGSLAAKVSMVDEGGAKVVIDWCCNRTSFDTLVPLIQQALSAMNFTGDK